jgi:hypothetical protein
MGPKVGFNEARKRVIVCLRDRAFDHEPRRDINQKNLLHAGKVSPDEVVDMVMCCIGKDHSIGPHDVDRSIEVHKLKPGGKFDGWYIKFYFVPNGTLFISVHQ